MSLCRHRPVSPPPREADRDRAAARLAPARAWPRPSPDQAGGHVRTTRPSLCHCAVTGRDRLGRRPGALAPFSVRQYPAR